MEPSFLLAKPHQVFVLPKLKLVLLPKANEVFVVLKPYQPVNENNPKGTF